ncbi:MAG: hypothetical protein L6R39_006098 [Caloplaca ligustica]|nr:MAG: hypothetical protein L6R39_006098 [Caloplaca ligustica]
MDREVQQAPRAVPRFGSFNPHGLRTPTPQTAESGGARKRPHSIHHREGSERRHRHPRKRRSPSSTAGNGTESPFALKQPLVEWDQTPQNFTIDVKGDPRNLEYGSSYGVPSYFPLGSRVALGSKTGSWSSAHHPAPAEQGKISISKRVITDLRRQKVLRVNATSTPTQDDDVADFVPLRTLKKREREQEDRKEQNSSHRDLDDRFYTLINSGPGPGSAPNTDDEHSTAGSTSDDDGTRIPMLDERLRQKRATLSSQVERVPGDWQSWLALVEVQDEMDGVINVAGQVNHNTIAERRSNAEVVLSILEKALVGVIDPEGRERLYLGMMSKASLIWETTRLSAKWQPILKEHPSSYRIWKKYLDFHQSISSRFSVEEVRKHHIDCLSMLQGVRQGADLDSRRRSGLYFVQVYILLRLTLLLKEGDYTELAVAIWQALLEFEFNKPHPFRRTTQQRPFNSRQEELLSVFETFWESEVPRIGEPNAKGWLNYHDDEDEQALLTAAVQPSTRPDSPALRTWGEAERKVGSCSRTPSRAIDSSSEDPYRVVFFSDIKPALIESSTSADQRTVLAAFLCFCHLPPYTNDLTYHTRAWYNDQFMRNELLYKNPEDDPPDLSSTDPFAFPLAEHPISPDTLFSAPGKWFSAFGPWDGDHRPIPREFILATLKALVNQGIGEDDLAEYLLAFELQVSPTTVLKSARNLLKQRPSSLRLYNAYALIQDRLGNGEMAITVLDTAIQMSAKLDHVTRRDVVLLWRSRTLYHLALGQTTVALEQLLKFGQDDRPADGADHKNVPKVNSATARLRLENVLSAGRDQSLSLSLPTHALHYSELLVLLSYLVSCSLQAALSSFVSNLHHLTTTPTPHNPITEALFRQFVARILYTHVTILKHPYSPRTIRSFLAESITAFPTNTIFLSLYAWNESRFRIDDRLRGIMRDVVFASHHRNHDQGEFPSDDIIPHTFAMYTDLHRGLALGSNPNAIRGTFERALRSDGGGGVAHNAGLWKRYFLYELHSSGGDLKRAKEVFYKAIGACPWVKELYMLAFEHLGDGDGGGMSETELRGVYDLMAEREVRIRVSL